MTPESARVQNTTAAGQYGKKKPAVKKKAKKKVGMKKGYS